ncbi:hypothetical protein DCC81_24795 [Chitinophaga parva]|uniref:Uncharacterized protein n=1 Tax=Chitinophaga parva TaxID=2169414 RepID=A0A2T7BBN7_9BACT|nr:hypothetical protein [Chitinophaga parva]PUZ21809.1 hypothetical protein DCC81_24795 [Chitinophaga parva]
MADNNDGLRFSLRAEVDDFLKDMQSAKQGIIDVASVVGNAVKDFLSLSKAADTLSSSETQVASSTAGASRVFQDQAEYVKLTGVEIARMGKYYTQLSYELRSFVGDAKRNADSWQILEAGTLDGATALQKETIAIANNIRALKEEEAASKRTAEGQNEFANALKESNYSGLAGVRTLHDLGRALTSGGIGSAGFTRSLVGAADQIGYLAQSTGSIQGAFKAIGSTLLGPSGIILGLTAVIEIVQQLTQEYGSLGNAVRELISPMSDQLKIQEELRQTLLKGRDDAAKEQVALDTLYNAARNLNIPLSERNKIVDELQKKYPEYFKNFDAEQIAAGKAQGAYEKLRDAILQVAQARALEDSLVDVQKKLNDAKLAAKGFQDALTAAKKANDSVSKGNNGPNYGSYGIVVGAGLNVSDAQSQVDKNNKIIESLEQRKKALLDLQKIDQDTEKTAASAGVGDKDTATRVAKTGESLKTVSSILEILKANIQAVKNEFAVTGGDGDKFIQKIIDQYKNAVGELTKIGVAPNSAVFSNIKSSVDSLQQQLGASAGLKPVITIPIEAKVDPTELTRVMMANNAVYIGAILKGFIPAIDKAKKAINETVKEAAASGIVSVGEAFGAALVSGDWQSVLGSFEITIANFLAQLGKLLIIQGLGIDAFKSSLATLQGETAIFAGVAMVAAAGAFRAFASKGPEKFATGGTVFGPTLALIGDNPSGVEHIIPQEVLDKMGGGSGFKPGDIIAQIKGNDLVLVMGRAQKQQRNNG